MRLADSHVHLHFPDYDADREAVIESACRAGVELFINVGTDLASSEQSIELGRKYPFIYATAGIHPHDSTKADEPTLAAIRKLLTNERIVAIGEVGLDFYRDHSPREQQIKVFRRFLDFHRQTGKPLVLHCRDAYDEMYEILSSELDPPCSGVMHCFSSDTTDMKRFVDLGFYISFAGPLTYKKNDVLREACADCPPDRLLLETDGPFLPPQTRRG